ncbi:MAG TPA: hypothetical protein VGX48_27925 [Pyrinomonadaceae bacterium]|jgi:hypothetical protein|nr:hypothetical protein [Pyrinomonadaceae bacterium]
MTQDEAITRARAIAEEQGWTWRGPVQAGLEHVDQGETIFSGVIAFVSRSLGRSSGEGRGRKVWRVLSNAGSRGVNVSVSFDAETGEVLHKAFWPR